MTRDRAFAFFSISFFSFLLSYLILNSIIIFFFHGVITTPLLLELTPLPLLRLPETSLLISSTIAIAFNTYFHFHDTRKNLIYSFIPSGLMLAGLCKAVATSALASENLFYYLLFACVLVIVVTDHDRILRLPKAKKLAPRKEIEHALYQRAMMLTKMAVESLDKLEARNPEYEGIFPAKALAYALLGDNEQAMRYWEEWQKREKK